MVTLWTQLPPLVMRRCSVRSKVCLGAGGVLTEEALAEMSEEEFQEVYERLKREDPKQLQALMM